MGGARHPKRNRTLLVGMGCQAGLVAAPPPPTRARRLPTLGIGGRRWEEGRGERERVAAEGSRDVCLGDSRRSSPPLFHLSCPPLPPPGGPPAPPFNRSPKRARTGLTAPPQRRAVATSARCPCRLPPAQQPRHRAAEAAGAPRRCGQRSGRRRAAAGPWSPRRVCPFLPYPLPAPPPPPAHASIFVAGGDGGGGRRCPAGCAAAAPGSASWT